MGKRKSLTIVKNLLIFCFIDMKNGEYFDVKIFRGTTRKTGRPVIHKYRDLSYTDNGGLRNSNGIFLAEFVCLPF
jgi:hypothetical protein